MPYRHIEAQNVSAATQEGAKAGERAPKVTVDKLLDVRAGFGFEVDNVEVALEMLYKDAVDRLWPDKGRAAV